MAKKDNHCNCGHDHSHNHDHSHSHSHSAGCNCGGHKHIHKFTNGICECGIKEIDLGGGVVLEAKCCDGHHKHDSEDGDSGGDDASDHPQQCNCGEDHHNHDGSQQKKIARYKGTGSKPLVGIMDMKPKTIQTANEDHVLTELIIEGLHCAGCAAKIERALLQQDGISSATINFATSTLLIKTSREKRKELIEKTTKIVEDTEPGTTIKMKEDSNIVEIEYILEGLNCAACAGKIERKVNALQEVKFASYNFATTILTVELDKGAKDTITEKITKIVVDLEPHVNVLEKKSNREINKIQNKNKSTKRVIKFTVGIAGLIVGSLLKESYLGIAAYLIGYLFIGGDIILRSYKNIRRGEIFDENFLMTIATIAAIGVGEYPEAIMVMLLYQIGEYFQGKAVESSRKSIANLMDIRPEYANIKTGGEIKRVSPEEVKIGDIIVVKPGEKVPLDGVIVEGTSSVDTRALTGESVPKDVEAGEEITSGFINIDGVLSIKVTKSFKNSAVSKILELVQNASAKKAKTELRITTFAKYYTPVVVALAAIFAVVPPLFFGGEWAQWIGTAASFLVVSCPCALVISVPMTYFAGLGASSKKGVLVKGGNYLEALSNTKTIVFDKTGTLTEGNFKVSEIYSIDKYTKDDILRYTAYVESFSTHPIAVSIVKEFGKEINKNIIKEYKETRGKGVQAIIDGVTIACGNIKFIREQGIKIDEVQSAGTVIYTVIDKEFAGYVVIRDQIKKDSKKAISGFKSVGIRNVVMLTGDRRLTAESAANELGITNYHYELLPQDKVEKVEELMKNKNEKDSLIFVGDGINDAPVLARADIGIAMGGVGSDAAIEAADAVIMNDEPSKIIDAIKIAKKTKKIVDQNIAISIGVKVLIMVLLAFNMANMMIAVLGDVGVTLVAVLNAMRVLKD